MKCQSAVNKLIIKTVPIRDCACYLNSNISSLHRTIDLVITLHYIGIKILLIRIVGAVGAEHGLDEGGRVKGLEVVDLLADADQLDGDAQGVLDVKDDAAFGGAVQFGQDQTGDIGCLVEGFSLRDSVLAGAGVQDQECFVWRFGNDFPGCADDLGQFLHEVGLGMLAAGRIDQHDVYVFGQGGPDAVIDHGGGIRALLGLDD